MIFSRRCFPDLIADATNDVAGAIGIAHHATERLSDLTEVRRLLVQKVLGCTGVVARAGDRLGNFVRQRGSQFSHYAQAIYVGEIRLHLLQSRQRSCAILDVRQQNVPADNTPGVVANWDAAVVKPPIFAVEAPQALFDLVGNA